MILIILFLLATLPLYGSGYTVVLLSSYLHVYHPDGELGYFFRSYRLYLTGASGILWGRHIYLGDTGESVTLAYRYLYWRL